MFECACINVLISVSMCDFICMYLLIFVSVSVCMLKVNVEDRVLVTHPHSPVHAMSVTQVNHIRYQYCDEDVCMYICMCVCIYVCMYVYV